MRERDLSSGLELALADPPTEVDGPDREPPFVADPAPPARSRAEVEALVEAGMPLVSIVARSVLKVCGARLDLDELRGPAHEALFEAARMFDPSRSSFPTFARKKMRWAMLNTVRKHEDLRARRRAHAVRVAERLREVYGEEPVDPALPESSHLAALRSQLLAEATAMALALTVRPRERVPSAEDPHGEAHGQSPSEVVTPEEELQARSLEAALRRGIGTLPPRQRLIVERHYYDGERFERIAEELGVSKSWVSRLHQQAMDSLAKLLEHHT